jgi:hypothetical protein
VRVARELMEAEVSAEIGAELGEVAPDVRVTHRNGYRPRPWETRVGEIEPLGRWISRSRRSVSGRWRAPPHTFGSTPSRSRSDTTAVWSPRRW